MRSTTVVIAAMMMMASVIMSGAGLARTLKVEVYDEVGPWRVLVVRSDKNVMRLVCSAYHQINSGLGRLFVVAFSKNWDGEWSIEFRNETWPIGANAAIAGSLTDLDSNEMISNGTPVHRGRSITFPIGKSAEQIQKFQKAGKLNVEMKSPAFHDKLELPTTKVAIDRINSCYNEKK